jgi:hypothetical protein
MQQAAAELIQWQKNNTDEACLTQTDELALRLGVGASSFK